jgi:hypothetical protein
VNCLRPIGIRPKSSKTTIALYFNNVPMLNGIIERDTAQGLELSIGINVMVATNSFRAVRGRPILCATWDPNQQSR